jgi:hypothetical protein
VVKSARLSEHNRATFYFLSQGLAEVYHGWKQYMQHEGKLAASAYGETGNSGETHAQLSRCGAALGVAQVDHFFDDLRGCGRRPGSNF